MAEQAGRRISHDRMDEPHIAGRRIPVRTIYDQVEERGVEPKTVAARLGLDIADVYRALAFYHEHPREMKEIRDERETAFEEFAEQVERQRPDHVTPPGE